MQPLAHLSIELSSRKRRIAAFLIDLFIMMFLLFFMIYLFIDSEEFNQRNQDKIQSTIQSVILPWILFCFAKDSFRGSSIGKWIMGIRIRDSEYPDEIPSFFRLFMRNTFLIIIPIEFIVLASNKDKKRLGDKLSRTIVVKNPNSQSVILKAFTLLSFIIAFFSLTFLFVFSLIKQSDAYKTAVIHIEKNEVLREEIGGIKDYGIIPSGNINTSNGKGNARLEITVIGEEKEVEVTVILTKESQGEWEVKDLYY